MLSKIPYKTIEIVPDIKTFLVDVRGIKTDNDATFLGRLTKKESSQYSSLKHETRAREYLYSRTALKQILNQESCFARNELGFVEFPQELIGSISHKNGLVILAVADRNKYWGLGIDIEMVREENAVIANKVICKVNLDKSFASCHTSISRIFSAKEALFKCHFPTGKKMFYFYDALTTSIQNSDVNLKLLTQTTPSTLVGHKINIKTLEIEAYDDEYAVSVAAEKI